MKSKLKKVFIITLILSITIIIGTVIRPMKLVWDLAPFKGIWVGEITQGSETYDLQLDIYTKGNAVAVKVSSVKFAIHYLPVKWDRSDDKLIFTMNSKAHEASYRLGITGEDTMSGTLTQYGDVYDVIFHKISDEAVNGKYSRDYPELTYKERKKQLVEFSEYAEDGVEIAFTYELNQKDKYEDLIREYNLDSLVEGYHDIELMEALLSWVSDNFKHDGSSGMPNDRNANAVIDYCKQNEGINCRGLAIILAEMLRVYGIPAKHITCMPKEAIFQDCHVVVHAYSEELKQWIMLDPTHKLILQDYNDNYVSLPMLRDYLINDTKLKANENAGRNGGVFHMEEYREYMTKNTFRFSCATDFYFGAEGGRNNNIENMLVPLNYVEDRKERNTTCDSVFWGPEE
ncbi:MAG TPA: transglutaminase-like domain-containing protein [Mobilitalea sp.]|nr:transglutaminase-like domain-containing protein [Mobilitalea sp.]